MNAKSTGAKRPKDTKKTIKMLLRYLGRHKFSLLLVAVLVFISCGANIMGTYLLRPVINNYILPHDLPGLIAMIGKAERGPVAIEAIKKHRSAYMIAVGGAAYLVAQAIRKARVLAFADLGMEAIYEFEVKDMPVTVAVDAKGTSLHTTGPAEWAIKIAARHNDTAATKA